MREGCVLLVLSERGPGHVVAVLRSSHSIEKVSGSHCCDYGVDDDDDFGEVHFADEKQAQRAVVICLRVAQLVSLKGI